MKFVLPIVAVLLPFVSAGLLGGVKNIDVGLDDEKVASASLAINDYFLAQNSDAKPSEVIQVLSATKQSVAGILYRLKLKMSGEVNQICEIELLQQVWIQPGYQPSNIHCEQEPAICGAAPNNGEVVPGGEYHIDAKLDDESVVFASSEINDHIMEQDANAKPSKAIEVLCATRKVIAGYLYTYKIKMSNDQICDVEVVYLSWLKPNYSSRNINCQ